MSSVNTLISSLGASNVLSTYKVQIGCRSSYNTRITWVGANHFWTQYSAQLECMLSTNTWISLIGSCEILVHCHHIMLQFVRQSTNFITWQESCSDAIINIDTLNFESHYTYLVSCRVSCFELILSRQAVCWSTMHELHYLAQVMFRDQIQHR
jgi:hypothetical protein